MAWAVLSAVPAIGCWVGGLSGCSVLAAADAAIVAVGAVIAAVAIVAAAAAVVEPVCAVPDNLSAEDGGHVTVRCLWC